MTTLSPYIRRYVRGRRRRGELTPKSQRDLTCRLDNLADSFGDRPIGRLTPKAIELWMETIGHLAPASRRAYLSTVRVFCRWLVKEKVIPADPCADFKVAEPRSVPRALAANDVHAVFETLPDERARAIVWLMVGLGLRRAEVASLEMGDYDPAKLIVTVTGKFGHQRVVPVPPEAVDAINAYIDTVGASHGPLIRSKTMPNSPLDPGTVGKLVSSWMRAAGVKRRARDGVSAHAFRHTAASDVLDQCHDLRVVQQLLGHQHLRSTAIYLRRAHLDSIRDAVAGRDYERLGGEHLGRGRGERAGRNGAHERSLSGDLPQPVAHELDADAHLVQDFSLVGEPPRADGQPVEACVVPSVADEEDSADPRHVGV